jgi:hypothetical protein
MEGGQAELDVRTRDAYNAATSLLQTSISQSVMFMHHVVSCQVIALHLIKVIYCLHCCCVAEHCCYGFLLPSMVGFVDKRQRRSVSAIKFLPDSCQKVHQVTTLRGGQEKLLCLQKRRSFKPSDTAKRIERHRWKPPDRHCSASNRTSNFGNRLIAFAVKDVSAKV